MIPNLNIFGAFASNKESTQSEPPSPAGKTPRRPIKQISRGFTFFTEGLSNDQK